MRLQDVHRHKNGNVTVLVDLTPEDLQHLAHDCPHGSMFSSEGHDELNPDSKSAKDFYPSPSCRFLMERMIDAQLIFQQVAQESI